MLHDLTTHHYKSNAIYCVTNLTTSPLLEQRHLWIYTKPIFLDPVMTSISDYHPSFFSLYLESDSPSPYLATTPHLCEVFSIVAGAMRARFTVFTLGHHHTWTASPEYLRRSDDIPFQISSHSSGTSAQHLGVLCNFR